MSLLFWLDVAALSLSTVVMISLGFMVLGAGLKRERDRCFAFFVFLGGGWAAAALLLRFSLWLYPLLPAGSGTGKSLLWLEMTGLLLGLMSNFAVRFTVLHLGRRTRRTDLGLNLGLVATALFSIPLFRHQLIYNPRLNTSGLVLEDMGVWGGVTAMIVFLYLAWSLALFWQERRQAGTRLVALSVLVLLAGIVLGGVLDVPFPFMSVANAISAAMLGTVVIGRQLFNPLRVRTIELQREIAEREQAESQRDASLQALQESENKHRTIIESIPLGMHMYELQPEIGLVFTGANPAADQILGVDNKLFVGQTIEQAFPALADSEVPERYRLAASTGEPWRTEQIDYQEGEIRGAFEVNAFQTSPGRMVAAFLDITDRLQAQEALQFTQFSIDHSAEVAFWLGPDAGFLYVNNAACRNLGYSCEELRSLSLHDIDIDLPKESWSEHWRIIKERGSFTMESRHRTREGRVIPVEVTANYLEFDGKAIICASARDITERKEAEEEREALLVQVQEQARQLEQVVETVPDGVLLLDNAFQVVLVNPAAESFLHLLSGSRVGDRLARLGDHTVEELLRPSPKGLWHEVTDENAPRRFFQAVARPLGSSPNAEGWLVAVREVTQERAVQQRAQRQERLAAVGQLAAGIAHDFNNTLAVITLYAQILRRSPNLAADDRERLTTISQQARRAADLTEQILDFSRKTVLRQRRLDLVPFLTEMARLLERTLEENVRVRLSYGSEEYVIEGDPTHLQQVLMNLAINARDAMPEGGELGINLDRTATRPGQVPPMPGMAVGEWVRLTVSDTGSGIAPDVLPHVFEPFFTTKSPGQGTGLGLAQVWGIVEQHQGHISVDSPEGQGTTFSIYLPARAASQGELATEKVAMDGQGDGQVILVVEDDALIRTALVESLEALNYRTLAAAHGREALDILESNGSDCPAGSRQRVALVLSDAVMPEMGGRALFSEIRKRELGVKMMMLTGHPLDESRGQLEAQGVSACLLKPPSLDKLARVIASVLSPELGESDCTRVRGAQGPCQIERENGPPADLGAPDEWQQILSDS